jgi:hypothetical protein
VKSIVSERQIVRIVLLCFLQTLTLLQTNPGYQERAAQMLEDDVEEGEPKDSKFIKA